MFEISPQPLFLKSIKALQKKYPSLLDDLENFAENLQTEPFQGISLGRNCYKVRFDIKSKKTGKRDNARIITCVKIERDTIYLLDAYDKSDKSTIKGKELDRLLSQVPD